MPEPDNSNSDHVERHVVVETVSSSSSKNTMVTFIIVAIIAIALIGWVLMHLK